MIQFEQASARPRFPDRARPNYYHLDPDYAEVLK